MIRPESLKRIIKISSRKKKRKMLMMIPSKKTELNRFHNISLQ